MRVGATGAHAPTDLAHRALVVRCVVVALFAVAMAYVESACVLYLRTLYGGIDPAVRAGRPVTAAPDYLAVEVGRETATMVMLGTMGWLAGRHASSRMAYFLAAFGVWDVFYYLWLWVFSGWPRSVWDWDVLFLIPLPWWGPVLTPCLVALEMAAGGFWLGALVDRRGALRRSRLAPTLIGAGVAVLLVAFMWDALAALLGMQPAPAAGAPRPVPAQFPWVVYGLGDAAALAGLAVLLRRQVRG